MVRSVFLCECGELMVAPYIINGRECCFKCADRILGLGHNDLGGLKVEERHGWAGNIKVTAFDLDGNITDVKEFPNLITTVGLNMVRDGLYGDVTDLEVKYLGVGSDNTAPALADTTLGTETFRKIMTSHSKPADAQFQFTEYIAPAEAVGVIEELGWFAGAAAAAGADTGIMIARVLYSRVKTAVESLKIERVDTFQEG